MYCLIRRWPGQFAAGMATSAPTRVTTSPPSATCDAPFVGGGVRTLHATVDDIPRDRGRNGRRLPQSQRSVAGWAVKAVRNEPWLLVLMLPVLVITLTLAAIGMMVWFVFLIAVLALGRPHHGPTHHLGRHRHPGQMGRGRGTHRGIAGSGWRWS